MASAGKMGNTFDKTVLKSPLTVGAPKGEKGPDVNNVPVATPADPLGYIPTGGSRGK
jgi:hypothetical protein